MMRWTKWSLHNAIAVGILCLLIIGAGLYTAQRMKMETFPDVTLPAVFVTAIYPGASTEQIEEEVTNPLEKKLLQLKDYETILSTSRENAVTLFIRYPFGYEMDAVIDDIEKAVDEAIQNDQVETKVFRTNPNDQPIYEFALVAPQWTSEQFDQLLDQQLIPELQDIEGVKEVLVEGGSQTELRVRVKAEAGIPLQTVIQAIRAENYAYPAGSLQQAGQDIPIRLSSALRSIEELRQVEVSIADKRVRVGDVAEIVPQTQQAIVTRVNGKPARMVRITKELDQNTVDVGDAVKAFVSGWTKEQSVQQVVFSDNAAEVKKSINTLLKEGGYGILATVLIILAFLRNIRATLIAIVSLPLSIFTTLIVLDITDNTLNIMTLGGLAVAVGRIVDDSIVVIENMFRWRQQREHENKSLSLLAYLATKEVYGPVASSTLATVVVFVPLAFLSGILGEFFTPFAITVGVSIVMSLLVAVTVIPVLGGALLGRVVHHEREGWLVRQYRPVLKWSLRHKTVVFVSSLLLLAGGVALIFQIDKTFLPSGGKVLILVQATLPKEAEQQQTQRLAEVMEQYFAEQQTIKQSLVSAEKTTLRVSAMVELRPNEDPGAFVQKMNQQAEKQLQTVHPEVRLRVSEQLVNGPPTNDRIEIKLYSDDVSSLTGGAKQVQDVLLATNGIGNVQNSLQEVVPKWEIQLRDEAKRAGVVPMMVLGAVNERIKPQEVGEYTWDGVTRKLFVEIDAPIVDRTAFENIPIPTVQGIKTLRDVAIVQETRSPITIQHENGKTNVVVSGDIIGAGANTIDISEKVQQSVQALELPKGVQVTIGGGFEDIFTGFESLGIAMAVAVGLVFVVLTATFGGVLAPLIVLTTLAFVPIGSLVALLLTGQQLSMSSMIGLLMLIGIVVTNAVVLLQRIEVNRRAGYGLQESVMEASVTRFRPILMTAIATIGALIPLALSTVAAGLISKTLAITVIGGLLSSTVFTLVFVPALYVAVGRFRRFVPEVEE